MIHGSLSCYVIFNSNLLIPKKKKIQRMINRLLLCQNISTYNQNKINKKNLNQQIK